MKYAELEKLGRVRLSRSFFMRDFLHSEVAALFGILNVPDDTDLAIHTGRKLCTEVLEPIVEMFGPIAIRSGFRSARLNAFAAERKLNCARNEKNYAYHIWDHRDETGACGAAACIVIPWALDNLAREEWKALAFFLHDQLDCYHRITFFRKHATFNIGWHETPRREIFSYWPAPHWLLREGDLFSSVFPTEDYSKIAERLVSAEPQTVDRGR